MFYEPTPKHKYTEKQKTIIGFTLAGCVFFAIQLAAPAFDSLALLTFMSLGLLIGLLAVNKKAGWIFVAPVLFSVISMSLLMKPVQESECSASTALITTNYHRVQVQKAALESERKDGKVDAKTYLQDMNALEHQENVFKTKLEQIDESVASGMLTECSDFQLLKVFKF
ncbi:hypothetical protein [Paraburkholderia aromaticivorans]|uniref:hypothetical protein n=1 Tax=Paraburkholderia aromaticivorans TaxID=2026199 RepID=UPI0038BD6D11